MKYWSIFFICVVFSISCRHADKKVTAKNNVKPVGVKPIANVQRANDTLAIPEDTIPKITIPEGTIQVGVGMADTISKVKILSDGSSYSAQDNINPKDAKLDWKGIISQQRQLLYQADQAQIHKRAFRI